MIGKKSRATRGSWVSLSFQSSSISFSSYSIMFSMVEWLPRFRHPIRHSVLKTMRNASLCCLRECREISCLAWPERPEVCAVKRRYAGFACVLLVSTVEHSSTSPSLCCQSSFTYFWLLWRTSLLQTYHLSGYKWDRSIVIYKALPVHRLT